MSWLHQHVVIFTGEECGYVGCSQKTDILTELNKVGKIITSSCGRYNINNENTYQKCFIKRDRARSFTGQGMGSRKTCVLDKQTLPSGHSDVQTHHHTRIHSKSHSHRDTCCGGRMKGVSHKHSSCVEWAALIVWKQRDVGLGWTGMWAEVVLQVCLCVYVVHVIDEWNLSYLWRLCFKQLARTSIWTTASTHN